MTIRTKIVYHPAEIKEARAEAKRRGIGRLLTLPRGNSKFAKNLGTKIRIVGLSLAQHKISGKNVCGGASTGCITGCVGSQGLARVWTSILEQRIRRTLFLLECPTFFRALLWAEIDAQNRSAKRAKQKLAVRLNTFSDLPFCQTYSVEIAQRSDIQFFDYTKIRRRYDDFLSGKFPSNYHLTFSRSEHTTDDEIRSMISRGGSVAVPMRIRRAKPLPTSWLGIPVVDGDQTDFRPSDGRGVIVGLRAKGSSWRDATGFVVDVSGGDR